MKSCEKYDITKGKWFKIADMLVCRKSACAVVMPEGIYVIGGFDGYSHLKSCEIYDFNAKKWKILPSMNFPKSLFSCNVSMNFNYIYTFGGFDGKSLNCIECFDVLNNKWSIIGKLPNNKYRHQSILIEE